MAGGFRPESIIDAFEFRAVACRIDSRSAGLHSLVYDNRTICFDACSFRDSFVCPDSAGYDDEIRFVFAPVLQLYFSVFTGFRVGGSDDVDPF